MWHLCYRSVSISGMAPWSVTVSQKHHIWGVGSCVACHAVWVCLVLSSDKITHFWQEFSRPMLCPSQSILLGMWCSCVLSLMLILVTWSRWYLLGFSAIVTIFLFVINIWEPDAVSFGYSSNQLSISNIHWHSQRVFWVTRYQLIKCVIFITAAPMGN
jgi:hypothetical protein